MIDVLLADLGFTKKETELYLMILQQGKISVTELASLTKINRTTVYGLLKNLIDRKVIREDVTSSKRYVLARPPEDLYQLIEKEKENLNKKEHSIRKVVSELETIAKNVRYSVPKIVFVDEDEIGAYLQSESPKWVASVRATDNVWWGFQDHTFVEEYKDWIDWYWTNPDYKTVPLRLLTNQSEIERKMVQHDYVNRVVKFWKQQDEIKSTLWVNGEYMVMIVTETKPHYLVEIHDVRLSANLRAMFRELWEKA